MAGEGKGRTDGGFWSRSREQGSHGGLGGGENSPGFASCKDPSGALWRGDRARSVNAITKRLLKARGKGGWTRRLALETQLNWTDADDKGFSVKDLLLVDEGKRKRISGRLGSW